MTSSLLERTAAAVSALEALSSEYGRLSDSELLAQAPLDARIAQLGQRRVALGAAEVVRRSDPALGHSGLAQRTGFRTPTELVKASTGSTGRDASTAVRVGTLVSLNPSSPVSSANTSISPRMSP